MIIGIEGVSCTGKSTLITHLVSALGEPLVVPCFYHAASDPDRLPRPVAADGAEQLRAVSDLLKIEAIRRSLAADALAEGRTVVLDRTVDTLLAHTFAISQMHGLGEMDAAQAMVRADAATMVPDVTVLLTVDAAVLAERARARPGMPPIFYAPAFSLLFNAYFEHQPLARSLVRLDSAAPAEELAALALAAIRSPDPGVGQDARSHP